MAILIQSGVFKRVRCSPRPNPDLLNALLCRAFVRLPESHRNLSGDELFKIGEEMAALVTRLYREEYLPVCLRAGCVVVAPSDVSSPPLTLKACGTSSSATEGATRDGEITPAVDSRRRFSPAYLLWGLPEAIDPIRCRASLGEPPPPKLLL